MHSSARYALWGSALFVGAVALGSGLIYGSSVRAQTQFAFPAAGAYTVAGSYGAVSAAYNYATPIGGGVTVSPYAVVQGASGNAGFTTFLGNKFRGIYFGMTRFPGPSGRWNLSDPFRPRPEIVQLSTGPYGGNGPFGNDGFDHAAQYAGGAVGELSSGEARFELAHGITLSSPLRLRSQGAAILSFGASSGGRIGQEINERWWHLFSSDRTESAEDGQTVIDATAANKFFLFAGGAGNPSTGQLEPVQVFQATNLTGVVGSNHLEPASSIGWPNVTELLIVEVPGTRNHFLLARSGSRGTSPTYYAGEIDAATGALTRENSFTLSLGSGSTGDFALAPGSNMESATAGSDAFVFLAESFQATESAYPPVGDLRIGAYRFDPASLTLTKKGDLTVKRAPAGGVLRESFQIAKSAAGDAYPILAALQAAQIVNVPILDVSGNPTGATNSTMRYALGLYGLKTLLTTTTATSLAPAADLSLPEQNVSFPLQPGALIVNQWPYQVFLKRESGRTNLYLYRNAFVYNGTGYAAANDPYRTVPITTPPTRIDASLRAIASLRVDRLDVSALGTGATPGEPTSPTSTPAFTRIPLLGATECLARYQYLCDQMRQLTRRICALVPGMCEP